MTSAELMRWAELMNSMSMSKTVGMTVVVSSKKVGARKLKRACRVLVTMSVGMRLSWTRRWTPSCWKYCRFRHCTVAVGRGFRVTEWTEIVDESFAKRICAGGKVSCVACHKFWVESEARRCRKGDGGTAESGRCPRGRKGECGCWPSEQMMLQRGER